MTAGALVSPSETASGDVTSSRYAAGSEHRKRVVICSTPCMPPGHRPCGPSRLERGCESSASRAYAAPHGVSCLGSFAGGSRPDSRDTTFSHDRRTREMSGRRVKKSTRRANTSIIVFPACRPANSRPRGSSDREYGLHEVVCRDLRAAWPNRQAPIVFDAPDG